MSATTIALTAVAVAIATFADARETSACLPPPGGVSDRTVLPWDGAVGVPRNARILVSYNGGDPGNTIELRVQNGATVGVSIASPRTRGFARLVTPDAPLAASTTYELLDSLGLPCDDEDPSMCLGPPSVIATFTTGTALDTSPPTLTGITVDSTYYCVGDSCPEAENEQLDSILIADQDDDFDEDWIRYEYLAPDGEVLAGPTSWLLIGRGCGGGYGYFPLHNYLALPSDIRLRAVDLAGNTETIPHPIAAGTCDLIGNGCDPEAPDAGSGATDGAGGSGCASGPGSSGTGAVVLMLVLGVLQVRRRRHR